jgi:V/A-type H+/Na+-transporting ATPase subunit I
MAIARLLKTEIVCGADEDSRLLSELEAARIIHIEDMHQKLPEEYAGIEAGRGVDTTENDAFLQKTKIVLDAFDKSSPIKKGLLENFFGSPPYVEADTFMQTVSGVNLGEIEPRIVTLTAEMDSTSKELARLSDLKTAVEPWLPLGEKLSALARMSRFSQIPIASSPAQVAMVLEALDQAVAAGDAAWAPALDEEKRASGIIFVVPEKAAEVTQLVKSLGVEPARLPDLDETPRQALSRIDAETESLRVRLSELESFMEADALENRSKVQAVADEHANAKKKRGLRKNLLFTRSVLVIRGWVLERDRGRLEELLTAHFPDSIVNMAAPTKEDNPPVKLENRKLLQPFQTLLEMFGLPSYFSVDPTWFVAIAMSLFYAICLGDAGYGACQILLTWWLMRKFKPSEGTRLFLRMFMEMGVLTVIFGILTWSFFGFSWGYEYGGPKILGFLPLFYPTKDILLIIGIGAAVGTVFQLGSILLSFYASLKNGDFAGAYFDRLAWLVMLLSGIALIGSKVLPGIPSAVFTVSLVVFFTALGVIVCFAGRESKGIVGRIGIGLISLYGIVGYYGIVSFLGDVLSYLRLAILNLTGGYISFVANTLGNLIRGGGGEMVFAILTTIIALLPMLLFHTLNFVLSMLGSFVHSLRLNYLESFSRYYGSGGKIFSPLKKEGRYYRFEL